MSRLVAMIALSIALVAGCDRGQHAPTGALAPPAQPAPAGGAEPSRAASLSPAAVASSRKIIRNAELALEVDEPAKAEQLAIEVTEHLGGFVVSSEARRLEDSSGESALSQVNMVLRVPSESFGAALGELRKLARIVVTDKVSAEDVTEQYMDVEAELRAKAALEAQFLDVLKQAKAVKDILEVQSHLAEVRTDIDKLEGRRRFLENQTALSTIQLHIDEHRPLVRSGAPSFAQSFRDAWADMRNFSVALVNGAIRSLGFLIPLLVLVGLPLYGLILLVRHLRKRVRRATP
jgi:hypothetical protein